MTDPRKRMLVCLIVVGLAAICSPGTTSATCPFCAEERGPTLVGDYLQSAAVLYGTFTNAKPPGPGASEGTTDFVIERILKEHEIVKGKDVVSLPKFMPGTKNKFIVFCDVFNGKIVPYRGEEVPADSAMLEYLTSALQIKDTDMGKRLRHCFDYLNDADLGVAMDAYREFAKADYTDYKAMAKTLPANVIAGWLEDPKTAPYRYGLYASLLGHCGDPKIHGDLLRGMIEDPKKRQGGSIDGLMAGYVMLQPKEAAAYLNKLLKDESEEYLTRFAALTTLRFFHEFRTDVLAKEQILKGMDLVLDLPDMADYAIEDLRIWKVWDRTDRVLDLFTKESHDHIVVRRAIVRFALCSPEPRAAEFVKTQRQRDPTWVNDIEEVLRIETPPPDTKKK